MESKRVQGILRVLSFGAALMYWVVLVAGLAVLAGIPIARTLDREDFRIGVPAEVAALDAGVESAWGEAPGVFELDDVAAKLEVPITRAPGWYVLIAWVGTAGILTLVVMFLHHLRRMLRRLRDGEPFDIENAVHLRWLGWLLIAAHSVGAVVWFVLSSTAIHALTASNVTLHAPLALDLRVILMGFALIALAEIFRHGAELEDEQSLVV